MMCVLNILINKLNVNIKPDYVILLTLMVHVESNTIYIHQPFFLNRCLCSGLLSHKAMCMENVYKT